MRTGDTLKRLRTFAAILTSVVTAIGVTFAVQGAVVAGPDEHEHHHEVLAPTKPIPGASLYQLKMDLTTQDGKQTSLAALRGRPTLVTMFYSSCQGICPALTFTMRRMEAVLSARQRSQLRVLMVSFDPKRDTPKALSDFAHANRLDLTRWTLAKAPENQVRELAAVLGIRYRELSEGVFSHSAVIALLDADGVIQAHTSTLNELDPQFMRTLTALPASAAPAPTTNDHRHR